MVVKTHTNKCTHSNQSLLGCDALKMEAARSYEALV